MTSISFRNAPAGTIRAALRYSAFRRLLSALAVSQIGDWLYNLALVVWSTTARTRRYGPASRPRPASCRSSCPALWAGWSPTGPTGLAPVIAAMGHRRGRPVPAVRLRGHAAWPGSPVWGRCLWRS